MSRKNGRHQFDLPSLELECMKALWSLGQATVHEIRAQIQPRRALAYTTVMTVMDRLAHKGVVTREKRGRRHLYRPSVTEQAVRKRAVDKLVDNFFGGSAANLLAYLGADDAEGTGRENRTAAAPDRREPTPEPVTSANESIDPSLL
jgi:BlaI family transcriptional regulator, penicillinase repressor